MRYEEELLSGSVWRNQQISWYAAIMEPSLGLHVSWASGRGGLIWQSMGVLQYGQIDGVERSQKVMSEDGTSEE